MDWRGGLLSVLDEEYICVVNQWAKNTGWSGWYYLMRAWLRRALIVGWCFRWM